MRLLARRLRCRSTSRSSEAVDLLRRPDSIDVYASTSRMIEVDAWTAFVASCRAHAKVSIDRSMRDSYNPVAGSAN